MALIQPRLPKNSHSILFLARSIVPELFCLIRSQRRWPDACIRDISSSRMGRDRLGETQHRVNPTPSRANSAPARVFHQSCIQRLTILLNPQSFFFFRGSHVLDGFNRWIGNLFPRISANLYCHQEQRDNLPNGLIRWFRALSAGSALYGHACFMALLNVFSGRVLSTSSLVSQARRAWRMP